MYVNRVRYSIDIDYRADLAGGLVLCHGIGVVIGCYVKTEGPVKIYQGVTLGGNSGKHRMVNERRFEQSWIYPHAVIYTNSVVIGPVIIGENAIVGTGSIITRDVPPNTMVYVKSERIDRDIIKHAP